MAMLEMVKDKIWDLLKEKDISLAMIYDREGRILWHKGREIDGRDVFNGDGFCKTYIQQSLAHGGTIEIEDSLLDGSGQLSRSAVSLLVKSVIIHPIEGKFFLYIDSGKKESFTEKDRISFRIMGELLDQVISQVRSEVDVMDLKGGSGHMAGIRELVVKYSLEEEPVLISGATGVGKNHIAGLIHRYSGRQGKFVVVDTPNIQDNLFESKLFGHRKGAFTDAKFEKKGLVEEARKGTLFFDEITEVPLEVQAKLLRFLDTHKYYMLGESTEQEADVRIIAATNKDLKQAVAQKEFRQDLYYRLNVLEIKIPPLQQRKEDIKPLVMENIEYLRGKEIGEGFWDVVMNYPWPGNVRELISFLKRVGIMVDSPLTGKKVASLLQIEDMPLVNPQNEFLSTSESPEHVSQSVSVPTQDEFKNITEMQTAIQKGGNFWDCIWRPFIDRDIDRNTVKRTLKLFFDECDRNFKAMTRKLNIPIEDYQKFMSLLYKYKIDPRT